MKTLYIKLTFIFLVLLVGCKNNHQPEQVLRAYIEDRIKGKLTTKESILEMTTGKYWAAINALSDEEFKEFENLKNIKQNGFKIINEKCDDSICYITYVLSYNTLVNDKKVFASEVKKVAELKLEDSRWKISDITNIKVFHDNLEPINPLE